MRQETEEGAGERGDALEAKAFEDLKAFIAERLHEPLSVETLARRYGCSPFHFARLFRRVVGRPPHDYIVAKRIERAKELLLAGDMPIGEIARRVGFGTQAHFSATFRERAGMTPSAFRASGGDKPA